MTPPPRTISTPAELVDALDIPFSDEQVTAITAPLEPGVIMAGAGSGKTTVMAARVVWLVGTGQVRPEQVLGLTFTRKAAAELSGRVRTALTRAGVIDADGADEAGEQLIMTYDAFAARLVSEHGLRIGVESDPVMITGATRYRLASRVVTAARGPFDSVSRLRPASVTERVLKLDSELTQHLVTDTELEQQARAFAAELEHAPTTARGTVYADVKKASAAVVERRELAGLARAYADLKRRLGVVEFADQMAVAARLAREVPAVGEALRATFAVVLLDEYQDTSSAQAVMLQGLFSGPGPDRGRGHPVTAVGDPFQAIYGWRGAAASNIVQFDRDFPRADGSPAHRFALTVNRRSGRRILAAANKISAPLRDALTKVDRGGADGGSRPPHDDGVLRAAADAGEAEIQVASFTTWPEEVTWLADRVAALAPPPVRPARGRRTISAPRGSSAREAAGVQSWSDIAVLTRRNADIGPLYAELIGRDIPVEIVGLGGLLTLPEVRDVVATLRVLHDVTANPDLVRLLTGPRWAIGPRDLAVLGRRAGELAEARHGGTVDGAAGVPSDDVLAALGEVVAEVDPTEMVSLADAVADPGDGPYSPQARERLARLAAELAALRRHVREPVLDLTRRVITTLGLDIELIAAGGGAVGSSSPGRRDQLAAFVDAVADYVDVDGDASLGGLLAWLQAEIDQGNGLDQAVPSDRDAVKLLTVHRAKGLEWQVVFLPSLTQGTFPSDRVTDDWVRNAAVLPAELRGDAGSIPQLAEASAAAMKEYHAALVGQQRQAEDRLAYVAVTRAKRLLIASGHYWRPDTVKVRALSGYLTTLWGEGDQQATVLAQATEPGDENPLITTTPPTAWPRLLDPEGLARRREAARLVRAAQGRAAEAVPAEPVPAEPVPAEAVPAEPVPAEAVPADGDAAGGDVPVACYELPDAEPLLLDHEQIVAAWDAETDRLLAEARAARRTVTEVPVPVGLSTTQVLRANADPDGFAADLARPMPRRPSRAAALGTRFHRWVEDFYGSAALIDPDDQPDRSEDGPEGGAELFELCRSFAEGRFATATPAAIEVPFELLVDGRLLRGRIDAVFPAAGVPTVGADLTDLLTRTGAHFVVVDWKSSPTQTADPLQLAVYRLAWARLAGVAPEAVVAGFHWIRADRFEPVTDLPDEQGLARLLGGLGSPTH